MVIETKQLEAKAAAVALTESGRINGGIIITDSPPDCSFNVQGTPEVQIMNTTVNESLDGGNDIAKGWRDLSLSPVSSKESDGVPDRNENEKNGKKAESDLEDNGTERPLIFIRDVSEIIEEPESDSSDDSTYGQDEIIIIKPKEKNIPTIILEDSDEDSPQLTSVPKPKSPDISHSGNGNINSGLLSKAAFDTDLSDLDMGAEEYAFLASKVSFPPYGQKGRLQSAASKLKTFLDSLEGRLESRANFKRKAAVSKRRTCQKSSSTSMCGGERPMLGDINTEQVQPTPQIVFEPSCNAAFSPSGVLLNNIYMQSPTVFLSEQPENDMTMRPGNEAYPHSPINIHQPNSTSSSTISPLMHNMSMSQLPTQRVSVPPIFTSPTTRSHLIRPILSAPTSQPLPLFVRQVEVDLVDGPGQTNNPLPSKLNPMLNNSLSVQPRFPLAITSAVSPLDDNLAPNLKKGKARSVQKTCSKTRTHIGKDKSVTAGNQKPIPELISDDDVAANQKTFPSMVVQVKTCLATKPNRQVQLKSRAELDTKVRNVLANTPGKFTEWLLRRGLLKLDHFCEQHGHQAFKLGMYDDIGRQPYSGGFVWTSSCCPGKKISLFSGSIFEGTLYPPGTVLKLVYHWACQTPISKILQWVQVCSVFVRNFYTLLRAVAISWLHEHCPALGGDFKYVEIGIITLGSSSETNKGFKSVQVEILGVFDPVTKLVRMKVINGMPSEKFTNAPPSVSEEGPRTFQILWALTHWVDKRSILLIDGIIDKNLLHEIGFSNVQQFDSKTSVNANNKNVMNYLRNLVPQMFSSTLSVLSKGIVQQFLDELTWREMYSPTINVCFENILDNIVYMTKLDLKTETLVSRLHKVTQNPFLDWSFTKQTRRSPLNTIPLSFRTEPGFREFIEFIQSTNTAPKLHSKAMDTIGSSSKAPKRETSSSTTTIPQQPNQSRKRGRNVEDSLQAVQPSQAFYRNYYAEATIKMIPLQYHYYGHSVGNSDESEIQSIFPSNVKCPLCVRIFLSAKDIVRHVYTHIKYGAVQGLETRFCSLCLKLQPLGTSFEEHLSESHKLTDQTFACRICEETFKTEQDYVIHMWDQHTVNEAPYRCTLCNFASSLHYHVVQHHHEEHGKEGSVMCPLCLKVYPVLSLANLKTVISHLQSHNSRKARKCSRCILSFASDIDLSLHLQDHNSHKGDPNWVEYTLPPGEDVILMTIPPKSRSTLEIPFCPLPKKPKLREPVRRKPGVTSLNAPYAPPVDPNEKYGGVKYTLNISTVPFGKGFCMECSEDISKPGHFIGRLTCNRCRFVTSCEKAMDLHHSKCHSPSARFIMPIMKTKGVELLGEPRTCTCGFSSVNPFMIATHLATCEEKTSSNIPKNRPSTMMEKETSGETHNDWQVSDASATPETDLVLSVSSDDGRVLVTGNKNDSAPTVGEIVTVFHPIHSVEISFSPNPLSSTPTPIEELAPETVTPEL